MDHRDHYSTLRSSSPVTHHQNLETSTAPFGVENKMSDLFLSLVSGGAGAASCTPIFSGVVAREVVGTGEDWRGEERGC